MCVWVRLTCSVLTLLSCNSLPLTHTHLAIYISWGKRVALNWPNKLYDESSQFGGYYRQLHVPGTGRRREIRENQQENYISEMNVIRCRVCIGTGRWEEKRREREKKKITELKACCRICIFKKWQREETRENYWEIWNLSLNQNWIWISHSWMQLHIVDTLRGKERQRERKRNFLKLRLNTDYAFE